MRLQLRLFQLHDHHLRALFSPPQRLGLRALLASRFFFHEE